MKIEYQVIRSRRKTLAIEVKTDGTVVVRAPKNLSHSRIDRFVREKEDWIRTRLEKNALLASSPPLTAEELRDLTAQAQGTLPEIAARYAKKLGVSYRRITIRCQKTRWGSCSSKQNLNFNCLLMLTPPEVQEYVVVHELCHLKEMNHSAAFWTEVERILPDYRERRQWLREHEAALLARRP